MRRLTILTLTDASKKQGDFVRMNNILRYLRQEMDIRIVGLPSYNEEGFKKLGKIPYLFIKEVARILLTFRVLFMSSDDIYYTWDWPLARNLAILSHLKRIDFVMEVNGLHSYESELRGYFKRGGFLHRHYICWGEKSAVRRAAQVVAVSKGFKNTLMRAYGVSADKIRVAPNAADLERFPFNPPRERSDAPFVVGWAGAFQPYQGLDAFIRLAEQFSREEFRIKFLIVGDGPARERYMEEIRRLGLGDYFDFTGRVAWEDVPEALAPAHCCAMVPDLSEAGRAYRDAIGITQLKTYEYMAMGKPIITYRLGDAEEIIDGNGVGVTCEPDDESIAQVIRKLSQSDLRQMARNARALAENEYNWRVTADKIREGLSGLER